MRSRDLYGPLPQILIEDTGDRWEVLDAIEREAAKLIAIVRVRKMLGGMYPGCEFLLPTRMDGGWVTGIRFEGRTVMAEGPTHWEAYHRLARKSVMNLTLD